MKITIEQTYDIDIPEVPKHLRETGGKRASIPIESVPSEVLQKIGEAWTRNLLAAAYPDQWQADDASVEGGES